LEERKKKKKKKKKKKGKIALKSGPKEKRTGNGDNGCRRDAKVVGG